MAKHVLTPEQQLKGVRKAIRTLTRKRGGPKWLLPSMKRYARKLAGQAGRKRARERESAQGLGD